MMAFVAVIMTALIGFLGLAVDVSHLYLVRGQLQNAADAMALAYAGSNCEPTIANTILTMNRADGSNLTLAEATPVSCTQNSLGGTKSEFIADVTITRSVRTSFLGVVSADTTFPVKASARAISCSSPCGSSGWCRCSNA